MKKFVLPFIIVLVLSLSGCSLLPVNIDTNADIETLKGWSFKVIQEPTTTVYFSAC